MNNTLDQLIKKRLALEFEQQVRSSGCRPGPAQTALKTSIELGLRAEQAIAKIAGIKLAPNTQEIKNFHRHHRARFVSQEMVSVSHVVTHVTGARTEEQTRLALDPAVAELGRGVAFAEVVERYSDCKDNGGHLGKFSRGYMVQEFDDIVFNLIPGQLSPVFRTFMGYHIALLHEKHPPSQLAFEDVRSDIERVMTFQKQQLALQRAAALLRQAAVIRRISRQEAAKIAGKEAPPQ